MNEKKIEEMTDFGSLADNELNVQAAKAMGYIDSDTPEWKGELPFYERGQRDIRVSLTGNDIVRWQPATDANQAIELAEHVRTKLPGNWLWQVIGPVPRANTYDAGFLEAVAYPVLHSDISFARALTIAALMALEAMEDGS